MASGRYIVIGRRTDCDVTMPAAAVSSRHARLSWQRAQLLLEDLGSANGTFVDGERIGGATPIQLGQDVRLGGEPLPWADERLRAFLRHGASDTIVAMPRFGRYACPKCKKLGILPSGFKNGELTCASCGTELLFGKRPRSAGAAVSALGTLLMLVAGLGAALLFFTPAGRALLGRRIVGSDDDGRGAFEVSLPSPLAPSAPDGPPLARSRTAGGAGAEERTIRDSGTAARILDAIDYGSATTRNTAVRVAASTDGPFHVEQVAAIWMHVRAEFDYVNDPRGSEYFARSSETIDNGYAGDCDDFATTLAAMTTAIGGRARIVMMDGPEGGHAYTEVCIDDEPDTVARRLRTYVRAHWNRTLGRRPTIPSIHHRADTACRVWLNLDWNANYPAGPYAEERWAVSIDTDRATETLAPAHTEPAR